MEFPTDEILTSLQSVLQSILLSNFEPSITVTSTVFPLAVKTSGLGGFIAQNPDPVGEIRGFQMEADIQIRISSTGSSSSLDAAISQVATAFSRLSRGQAIELGILRLGNPVVDPEVRESGRGNNTVIEQKMTYRILYEFLKRPESSEGLIQTIPLNLSLADGTES